MAANEVAVLGTSMLGIVSKIQELGGDWYKASQSWNDFSSQADRFRRKDEIWQVEFTELDMLSDSALIKTLREAEVLLEKEKATLLRREAEVAGLRRSWSNVRSSKMVFPAQLALSIRNVNDAFDDIPTFLTLEKEIASELANGSLLRPVPVPILNDDRYVHLRNSETAIRSALDSDTPRGGPAVVLLHGGLGKGKSTLARYMVTEYYTQAADECVFDQVVYLECGPRADFSSKQLELVLLLGSNGAVPDEPEDLDYPNFDIPELLTSRLRDEKLLLVLDDVVEPEFLQSMVAMCGGRVKCLVTSQHRDLCEGLNCPTIENIQIQDIRVEDARKILGSHVRLPEQHIPKSIEMIADRIIEATEAHPLVLACIAISIDHTRSDEVIEWEAAAEDFFELLRLRATAQILGNQYPTSFWPVMQLALQTLTKEERTLLIVIHMCDGPSIPEEVIRMLHSSIVVQGDPTPFAKLRRELENRGLVKITLVSSEGPVKQRSWSIHSLQKLFIQDEMQDARESTFTALSGAWDVYSESRVESEIGVVFSEAEVGIALSALYYHNQFAEVAATKMGLPFQSFSNLRRRVMEPVTRLIGRTITEEWTEALRSSASKVFLRYICYCALDDQAISDLLASPVSALPTLSTLYAVALIENKTLVNEKTPQLLKALTRLLGEDADGADTRERDAAALALARLCHNEAFHLEFPAISNKWSGVFEAAVRILSSDSHPRKQYYFCMMLARLSHSKSFSQAFFQYPGALVTLVECSFIDNNPQLQETAAWTLGNVFSKMSRRPQIPDLAGAVEGLVQVLSKESEPPFQEDAAWALDWALENSLGLQENAMWALANLANWEHETKLEIVTCPGALEQLVRSLSKENNRIIQYHAATALANLANGEREAQLKIVNSPGLLEELVRCLAKEKNPRLQEEAARALASLAYGGDHEIELKIINFPGALEELVRFLSKEKNSGLQKQVTKAFYSMTQGMVSTGAGEEEYTKMDWNTVEGLMDSLVGLLDTHISPSTQGFAAGALTLIDSARGNAARLYSASAYSKRGFANLLLGRYQESLADLDKAIELGSGDDPLKFILSYDRCTVRAKMGDLEGALADANNAIEIERQSFGLQERGVLKRMMGDLSGALADLREASDMETDDYHILKHRGYVKFLMKDEDGARADAELALRIKPRRVDDPGYGRDCLGTTSVKYLDYNLR